ncbi:sensor histidine kinase [Alteribacter lacisalsi]|uniref:histidine kinase n=1 Tax=Alteribacter lacisalsi TaxID=2045244 RepID=A0A2W0HAV0_9BACI|nr:sensor histidine kinase [Alteribacter lacisalsi]PYZ98984.1 sensor histidine kinase [Alteribacter lacisalsi]
MKLSTKLSLFILAATTSVILIMGVSYYFISKNFYQSQLEVEVVDRLQAHREAIEAEPVQATYDHVLLMEQRNSENSFLIFNEDLSIEAGSDSISDEDLAVYQSWLTAGESFSHGATGFVETVEHHIPHIWAFEPIVTDGNITGYLFLDQDTGEFETIKQRLVMLIVIMSAAALILSGFMVLYYSNKITSPLVKLRQTTREIATGNFNVEFSRRERDELSFLIEDISEMANQLKEYRDTKQSFLSNVSHDLRTPLTYIKAYSALMKEKEEDQEVREQSGIIYREAERMEKLVQDLFDLMKLEEGKEPLSCQITDLSSFLREVSGKVRLRAEEKNLTIEVNDHPGSIYVNIDPFQMERALLNLIENCIRHTWPGGSIIIETELLRNEVIVKISDTGEGIPGESLQSIWDRFYRVDKARNSERGGSGLGLPITKQIIEQHGGSIHVSSVVGTGTTFYIHLFREC